MADGPTIGFSEFAMPSTGVLVVFCDDSLKLGPATRRLLGAAAALVARAAAADNFKGRSGSTLDLVAPGNLKVARLVVIGCGKPADLKAKDFVKLGGAAMGRVPAAAAAATILAELDSAGSMDEAKTTQLVRQLLPKHGVKADTVKKIIVRPWNAAKNTKTIILLSDLADEKQALAANEPAAPGSKVPKSTK